MRLFEILLLSAETLLAMALILGRRAPTWAPLGFLVQVPVLLAVLQISAEGFRWQMIPAYALVAALLAAWLVRYRHGKLNGAAAVAVLMGLATCWFLPVALPVFRFPDPTGPYAIGTLTYHWTDLSRREVFSADKTYRREVMVQIWYPAEAETARARAPYVDDAEALATAQARLHGLPDFTLGHLKYIEANAAVGARAAGANTNYPVLIFLEGLTGYRQMNTFQVEALVSEGYIVVAIDQPFVAATVVFPDGRQATGLSKAEIDPLIQQSLDPEAMPPMLNGESFPRGIIPYLVQDVAFVLDRLTALNVFDPNAVMAGQLDMQRVGVFGVSIGAIVAGEACHSEPRMGACLMMDAPMTTNVVHDGLRQPSLWITRDAATMRAEGWAATDIRQHQSTMRAAFEFSSAQAYLIQVAGIFHANLTDVPYFSPLVSWLGVTGPTDGRRAHTVINTYSLAFFDRHLKDRRTALLGEAVAERSGVSFEARRPGRTRLGSP